MFAYSNYSANEALDILEGELHRSRTNMSVDTVWLYLRFIRNIERTYKDLDEVIPLSTLTILLDKLALRNERRHRYSY